jgi:serine/threonine protein kinase
MDLSPDTYLHNRYRIIRPLGKGGMGAVYLAVDTSLEHEVAVKSNRNPRPETSDQFMREARLLAKLRHPSLPRVIDYFISSDIQYLVMDYIAGEDLESILKTQPIQPLDRVLYWARELGDGLIYLHSQNPPIIHRDIKPANIKLTPGNEIILVDFGISKTTDNSQATAAGAIGYTPGYAPPEQYGFQRTGPYSDQYALAATLYRALTGVRPSDGAQRVLGQAVLTPINQLNPSIPFQVWSAIEKALAVRPDERFASVGDFLSALTGTPFIPSARSQPAYQPTRKAQPLGEESPAKRKFLPLPCLILGGIAVLLGLVGVIVGGLYYANRGTGGGSLTATNQMAQGVSSQTPTPQVPYSATPEGDEPVVMLPTILFSPTPTPESTQTPPATALGGGKRIVFASDRADGKTLQLWTMKAALNSTNEITPGELTQLTFTEGDKQEPAWSPDGKKLVFTAPGPTGNGLDLWLLDVGAAGNEPVRLTDIKGDDTNPSWSPDGQWIAFVNFNENVNVHEINLIKPDSSGRKRITIGFDEYNPIFSMDMQWLFYVLNASSHQYFNMRSQAQVFAPPPQYDPTITPTATPNPERFDQMELFGRLGNVADPDWTRDGQLIAYTRIEGAQKQIYSMSFRARGGDASLISEGAFKESNPAWAPDNQWIVFNSERDGNPEIYVMTSTGKLQTNLSKSPAKDIHPAWEP